MTTDAFAGRVFGAATASLELATVYLGDRLGLYRALAEGGPLTAAELAAATGTHERYVQEWARAQAVCGIVEADDGHYRLPPSRAPIWTRRRSTSRGRTRARPASTSASTSATRPTPGSAARTT